MKSSAIRLPRRRFLKLRGNVVELAVGLLVVSMLQAEAAHAETLPASDDAPAPAPAEPTAAPTALQGIDPEAIRTLSIDELKQMLDAKTLAALGLDAGFLHLLDTDASAAIHRLEAAFREKVKAVAKGEAKIAAAGDLHAGDHADAREGADVHHESALGGGFSPLWLLGGLAVVGGGIALAGGGGGNDTPATAANVAPTAVNDAVATSEDTPVTFDVRGNDSDRDGGTLAVTQINGTAITTASPVAITGGSISLGSDGRLTFAPAANYNGAPSFTYTLSDGQGGTATATVALSVAAVNDAPVAAADSFTTAEDTPVTIAVRANDSDVDGNALSVTQVNGTAISATTSVTVTGGVVTLNAAGNLVFTPTANFNGSPSFTYTVSDGQGGTATASVGGTVTAVNDAPVNALPASIGTVAQGAAIAIPGLSVSDVDGGSATFTTTLSVAHGTLLAGVVAGGASIAGSGTASLTLTGTLAQVNATLGAISYTSIGSYAGSETLTIVTSDGQATDTDTLALNVAQVTQGVVIDGYVAGAQIFFDANGNGTWDEGEVVATTDAQGRFVLVGEPRGTMIALGGINTDTGLPNTIALKAPAGATAITPMTTLVAELVEAGMDLGTAQAQIAHAFGLPEGLDLGSFDFLSASADPALGFMVQKAALQIATLMIQAQAAGVSSTAIGEQLAQMTANGAAIDLGDPAWLGSLLTAAGADPATATAAAQKAAAINLAIAAAASPDALVDTVRDMNQPDADLAPVTVRDLVTTAEDKAVTFDVRGNDSDPEGGALTVTRINGIAIPTGGSVAIEGGTITLGDDGRLTFQPVADFNGSPAFTYTVADPAGNASDGTVGLTVTAVNDAPVAVDDRVIGIEDRVIAFDPAANDTDVDGDRLVVTAVEGQAIAPLQTIKVANGTILMTSTGALVFTPDAEYSGSQSLRYTVSDGHGGTAEGQVSLTIDPVNDAPVTIADTGHFGLGVPATIDVLANDGDVEGDSLHVVAINGTAIAVGQPVAVANGTVSLGSDGRLSFAANDGFLGNQTFGYTVSDGHGGTAEGVVTASLAGPVLPVAAGSLASVQADALAAAGVTTLDMVGDAGQIGDAQAQALVAAGIDFAEADTVTLTAEGTTLNTSLKGLQSLHVDAIKVAAGVAVLAIDAGGTLSSLDAGSLPSFTALQGDAALDVTLTVDGGAIDPAFDMRGLASALGAAGIDHLNVAGDGAVALTAIQGLALARSGIDFADAADVTLGVDQDQARALAGDPALLAALHVDHLDVIGDRVELADSMAERLVAAGVDFVTSDDVTVTVEGTHLGTTLKGLQSLHVDSVRVAAGVAALSLDAGGSLGSISAADLPHFDVAQGDGSLDVTLSVDPGTLDAGLDLAGLAADLRGVGIDHLGVGGSGALSLDLTQAQALAGAGLDFATAADITLDVTPVQAVSLATDPALLASLHVDHLDVSGAVAITETQAAGLIGAGVDFAESDDVTLSVEGTHMATSLKGLEGLHVDTIRVAAGVAALTVAAGGTLETVSAADLPHFAAADGHGALDVTLTVDAGTLDRGFDLAALAPVLSTAGVDHLGVAGSGALGVSLQQAWGVSLHGLDFTPASEVVVHLGTTELAGVSDAGEAALLARINVDTLDVIEDHATISDDQAANLVAAGLHFAEGDDVTVAAEGTHMSTSLRGLHDLRVDAVSVGAEVSKLVIDAGDLTGISASDLPQFDVYATDDALDVTLRVEGAELADVARLAQGLADAGIDHIVTNQDLSTIDPAEAAALADMTRLFGIDVSYQPFEAPEARTIDPAAAQVDAELLTELRAGYEGPDDDGTGGVYRIADGAHHALAESGLLRAYTADTLVIDGTQSSDKLLTTLKDIADMGVDEVRLADGHGTPVYVDLGDAEGAGEIRSLLQSLEHGANGPDPIFQGSEKVALVLDADAAHALAEVDGAVAQLKAIGITEIDVLADDTGTAAPAFGDTGLEVKLIGQDDELYRHLHHER